MRFSARHRLGADNAFIAAFYFVFKIKTNKRAVERFLDII